MNPMLITAAMFGYGMYLAAGPIFGIIFFIVMAQALGAFKSS